MPVARAPPLVNKKRGEMGFMGMKLCVHDYLDRLCFACNLENNNRWNYTVREGCFILVSNSFRWCVILVNRVHETSPRMAFMAKPVVRAQVVKYSMIRVPSAFASFPGPIRC